MYTSTYVKQKGLASNTSHSVIVKLYVSIWLGYGTQLFSQTLV